MRLAAALIYLSSVAHVAAIGQGPVGTLCLLRLHGRPREPLEKPPRERAQNEREKR